MKTLDINRAQAVGHVHLFYSFVAEFAETGDLKKLEPEEIEAACEWTGEAGKLFEAFLKCFFIDKLQVGFRAHGFYDENTRHLKDISRKRRARSGRAQDDTEERDETYLPDLQDTPTNSGFDAFWSDYPNKVNKQDALKLWGKLSDADRAAAHKELPRHKNGRKWLDGFVMGPDRYLRGRHWEDATEAPKPGAAAKECPPSPATGRHDWRKRTLGWEGNTMKYELYCHYCDAKKPAPK